MSPRFYTHTALAEGLRALFQALEQRLSLSRPLNAYLDWIKLHVLAPVDLAVSKIARFADNDKEDIVALVRSGLTSADEIESRATDVLAAYVGGQAMLKLNLRDALALARQAETSAR